jgi:hypothetical protein
VLDTPQTRVASDHFPLPADVALAAWRGRIGIAKLPSRFCAVNDSAP